MLFFGVLFSGVLEDVMVKKTPAPTVPPSGGGWKSLPMPGPIIIPMPEPEPSLFTKFTENTYVKGAPGLAVGWVVKGLCDWIWGLLKSLFKRKTE
jgi:hypothetical protein